ncbi:MAG: hypothetical protein KJZ86_20475 [Caldilineaceae bacterium]|nr:hypothetical protein [Caldilineaceae bacterium]
MDRLLPHSGGGWVGVSSYGAEQEALNNSGYLFSHPTLPLPIPGRKVERLLPHSGGGWVGVSSY